MTKKNFLYVIPLLTLLSVSPTEMLKHHHSGRSIASIEVEIEKSETKEEIKEEKFPKYTEMISLVDPSNLLIIESVTKESMLEKSISLKESLNKEKESFNKDATDKEEIAKQRSGLESLVVGAVLFDKEIEALDKKEKLDEELKNELHLSSVSHKEILELLLTDLEENELLLDTLKIPNIADTPKEEDKKEEIEDKKEEPKIAKEDVKEDKKEDKKEEICEASEQVKVLTTQVEALMEQQNLILQSMLNLTQAMANMTQNMQQQQPYFPMPQTAYQYNAPMTQGSWVYQPQGFQPVQMNQGFYPVQSHQPQNNWNIQPSQNLQFQQPIEQPMQVGQFSMAPQGMNNFASYNMSSAGNIF